MTERVLQTLLGDGGFFEGPRWHDGTWWVSDFYRHTVSTVTEDGTEVVQFEVEAQPSGLGWLPDGSLVVSSMKDHKVLRWADGVLSEHADLSEHATGHLNDLVVDAAGHAYVGNFGYDLMGGGAPSPAKLVRVDPDGAVAVVDDALDFPNGSVILADGVTLVVGETIGMRYTAFTIQPDGSLADRRLWADLSADSVLPDGCTLDAAGHIWAADALSGRVVRIAPGGAIVDSIAAPDGLGCFACALGGDDGATLLICAAPDYLEQNRSVAREAVLLTTRVDEPHAGLP